MMKTKLMIALTAVAAMGMMMLPTGAQAQMRQGWVCTKLVPTPQGPRCLDWRESSRGLTLPPTLQRLPQRQKAVLGEARPRGPAMYQARPGKPAAANYRRAKAKYYHKRKWRR